MTRRRRAEARRWKREMRNFLSRKKWAMTGARYPGIELAAQKSVTRMQKAQRRRATEGILAGEGQTPLYGRSQYASAELSGRELWT